MTYAESANLMTDFDFRGRVKVAGLKFATSILNEPTETVGHPARYRWAQTMTLSPDSEAQRIQPTVVMDPAVQSAGSAIDDGALQNAVEAVINKFI